MATRHGPPASQTARALAIALALLPILTAAATISITNTADLSAAVGALANGDILQLAAGVYSGAKACSILVAGSRNVTLSAGSGGIPVLDCGGAGRHFDVSGGATVRLVGLSLIKGAADFGGCLRVAGTGTAVYLINSMASYCTATTSGGALYVTQEASVILLGGSLQYNTASASGGGAFLDGASVIARAQSQIVQNSAALDGAGLYLRGASSLTLQEQSSVSSNAAARNGGGVFLTGSTLAVADSSFSLNRGTINGGAILAFASSTVTLSGATSLDRNTALKGAGLYLTISEATLMGPTVIKDNTAYGGGSAIYAASSALSVPATVQLSGNSVPGTWSLAGTCTNAPKTNAAFDNAIVQEGGACSSLCESGYYEQVPMQGDLVTSGACVTCPTGVCSVGSYRSACAGRAGGECQACTNKIPFSTYTGAGTPFDANTCAYQCNAGYGPSGSVCAPCPAGTYKPAPPLDTDACKTSCSAGSYASLSTGLSDPLCFPCTTTTCGYAQTRGPCGAFSDTVCVPCPLIPGNAQYVRNGTCDWLCVPGMYRDGDWCYPCPTSDCPVGKYRGVCGGYSGGGCQDCTNGPAGTAYTSAGKPYNADKCDWVCVDSLAPSTPRPGLTCAVGQYVGQCACQKCTNKPAFSVYTSVGTPLQNNCAWMCASGYYRTGDTCQQCGVGACAVGEYRGACDDSIGGTCQKCTNKPAMGAAYASSGDPPDSNACAWECAEGFFLEGGGCVPCNRTQCAVGEYRGACGRNASGACLPCTTKPSPATFYTTPGEPFDEDTCAFNCSRDGLVALDEGCCPVASIEFAAVLDVDPGSFGDLYQGVYLAAVRSLADKAAGELSVDTCVSITDVAVWVEVVKANSTANSTRRQGAFTLVNTLLQANDLAIAYVALAMTAENLTAELKSLGMSFGVKSLEMSPNNTVWIIPRPPIGQEPRPDQTGAIVGGVLGGFFGSMILIAIVYRVKGWETPGVVRLLGACFCACIPSFSTLRRCFRSEGGQMKNKSGGTVLSSAEKKRVVASTATPKKTPSIKRPPDVEVSNKPEVKKDADEKA